MNTASVSNPIKAEIGSSEKDGGGTYAFPYREYEECKYPIDRMKDALETLIQQCKTNDDYLTIRNKYCHLSLLLNINGLWAPAFRPSLIISANKNKQKPVDLLIQQDRLVIDCHWLFVKKERIEISISESVWRNLFPKKESFPFSRVQEFAEKNLKNEYRAEGVLRLTPRQQCQMNALKGNVVRDRFERLKILPGRRAGEKRIPPAFEKSEIAINRWSEADARITPYRSVYKAIAIMQELVRGETLKNQAELVGLILGAPRMSENLLANKKLKLQHALNKYG